MSYNSLHGLGSHSADADTICDLLMDDNAASTTLADRSGNGNDATHWQNTSSSAGPGSGWFTRSMEYNGSTSYSKLAAASASLTDLSMSAWVRVRSTAADGAVFAQFSNTESSLRSWLAWSDVGGNDGFACVSVRGGSNYADGTNNTDNQLNTWKHVSVAVDDGTVTVYVDGVQTAQAVAPGGRDLVASPVTLGANYDTSDITYTRRLIGDIGPNVLMNRVWTAAEVAEDYAGPEPLNLTAPAVSGIHETGETLTATDGTWDSQANGTVTYTYQWQTATDAIGTGLTDIKGATASAWKLRSAQSGLYVRCLVSASNDGGIDEAESTGSAWTLASGNALPSYNETFGLGSHDPDADLQGWWKMDDNAASTAITDYSGQSQDGVLSAGTTAGITTAGAKWFSSALNVPAASILTFDYPSTINPDGEQTLMFWANGLSSSSGNVAGKWPSGDQFVFVADYSGSDGLALAYRYAGQLRSLGSASNEYGNWTHYTARRSPSSGKVNYYRNASGVGSGTYQPRGDRPLVLGGHSSAASGTDITFGESAYFSRAITDAENAEAYAGPEPLNLTAPAVSGTHETGELLTATDGTWDSQANGTVTYTYQWQRADDASGTNAADISGATASTYTLQVADENKYVRFTIASSNNGGNDAAEDQQTAWTLASPAPVATASYNSLFGLGTHSPDAALEGWWKMDDNAASTVITDYSGNGRHGTASANTDTLATATNYGPMPNGLVSGSYTLASDTILTANTETTFGGRYESSALTMSGQSLLKNGGANSCRLRVYTNQIVLFCGGQSNEPYTLATNTPVSAIAAVDNVSTTTTQYAMVNGNTPVDPTTPSTNGPFSLITTAVPDTICYDMFCFSRYLAVEESQEVAAGPEPLYIGSAQSVFQTANYCAPGAAASWDSQANGTVTSSYVWEVADDASGTNAATRSFTNRFFPSADDAGKYVRYSVSGSNNGGIDDAETQVTPWVLLTATPPASQGRTAVVHGELNNAGTTDFTVPGFGNVAGAIFMYMMSDGATAVERDSSIGFGFESWSANGAVNNGQYSTHARRDDAVSSGDFAWRGQTITYPVYLTVTGQSWTAGTITDGVRLTVSTAGTDVVQCTVILFDENCHIETGDVGATDGAFDSVNFGFEPAVVFNASGCTSYAGTAVSAFTNVGAFDKDGNSVTLCGSQERNDIPTSVGVSLTNGDWARQYAYGSISWTATPSWANGGWTMDLAGGSGAGVDRIPWFAVGNIGAKCGTFQVPNSISPGVGDYSIALPGDTAVTPDTVVFLNSLLTSEGVNAGTSAAWFGFGVDDGTTAESFGVYQKRAASPTSQSASTLSSQSQGVWYDGGSAPLELVKGTVSAFNEDEIVVNYTQLGGNNYAAGYIVFGEVDAGGGPSPAFQPAWAFQATVVAL